MTFEEFLQQSETAMKHLLAVMAEWYKMQGEAPPVPGTGSVQAPPAKIGATPVLGTQQITAEEIDKLAEAYGTGIAKEKAIQYVKGFIAGIMAGGI